MSKRLSGNSIDCKDNQFPQKVQTALVAIRNGLVPSLDYVIKRESAGTGPVVLKVFPATGTFFEGHHGPINARLFFPTPTIGMKYEVPAGHVESIG